MSGESAGGGSVMLQSMAYGGLQGTSLFNNVCHLFNYDFFLAWLSSSAYANSHCNRLSQQALTYHYNTDMPMTFLHRGIITLLMLQAVLSQMSHGIKNLPLFSTALSGRIRKPCSLPALTSPQLVGTSLGVFYLSLMAPSFNRRLVNNYSRNN